jgi:hypothetical protein
MISFGFGFGLSAPLHGCHLLMSPCHWLSLTLFWFVGQYTLQATVIMVSFRLLIPKK